MVEREECDTQRGSTQVLAKGQRQQQKWSRGEQAGWLAGKQLATCYASSCTPPEAREQAAAKNSCSNRLQQAACSAEEGCSAHLPTLLNKGFLHHPLQNCGGAQQRMG